MARVATAALAATFTTSVSGGRRPPGTGPGRPRPHRTRLAAGPRRPHRRLPRLPPPAPPARNRAPPPAPYPRCHVRRPEPVPTCTGTQQDATATSSHGSGPLPRRELLVLSGRGCRNVRQHRPVGRRRLRVLVEPCAHNDRRHQPPLHRTRTPLPPRAATTVRFKAQSSKLKAQGVQDSANSRASGRGPCVVRCTAVCGFGVRRCAAGLAHRAVSPVGSSGRARPSSRSPRGSK